MAAYVVVNVTIRDPFRYDEYRRMATPTVAAYDGRYVARGGAVDVREGDWTPSRLVILEFPSVERARAWWDSPEYAPLKQMRLESNTGDIIVVEGGH